MTYAAYLELERETDTRHEFLDGAVFAMSGGTPRHSKLKINLAAALVNALGDGRCQPYDSDLKVRVLATGLAAYPDLTVVCGDLERHPEDPNAITNPTAVFEVLSPTTEAWDRGEKFAHLQQVPSLRHYVLLSQDRERVEHFARQDDGTWRYRAHGAGETTPLEGMGVTLSVDDAYRNLPPLVEDV